MYLYFPVLQISWIKNYCKDNGVRIIFLDFNKNSLIVMYPSFIKEVSTAIIELVLYVLLGDHG